MVLLAGFGDLLCVLTRITPMTMHVLCGGQVPLSISVTGSMASTCPCLRGEFAVRPNPWSASAG
jgi:hypothetical protein